LGDGFGTDESLMLVDDYCFDLGKQRLTFDLKIFPKEMLNFVKPLIFALGVVCAAWHSTIPGR